MSCHGTRLLDYIGELEGLTKPVCIVWGDLDHAAPPPVQEAYRKVDERMANVDVNIFPGVRHGYMMKKATRAFDQKTRDFTTGRVLALLDLLRREKEPAGAR